jgi:transglutaminase-like putative cysteine protease/uncharacterized alpha-E superfamily protein
VTATLLARTAESIYWAGRYLERAEGMARVVLVHGDTHVDLPVGEDVGWSPLLAVAGLESAFQRRQETAEPAGLSPGRRTPAPEAAVVKFLLHDEENPAGVLATVAAARRALRLARPAVPAEMYELGNELWLALRGREGELSTRDGRVRWLREVIAGCQRMNGVLWTTMPRDARVAFFRLGQYLERADLVCRVLAVRAEDVLGEGPGVGAVVGAGPSAGTRTGTSYDEVRAMGVMRSLAAYQPFRSTMPARPAHGSAVHFLLQDEAFPRAVAACLAELQAELKTLPRIDDAYSICADASVRLAGAAAFDLSTSGLRELIADLQPMLVAIHHRLDAAYFHGGPTGPSRDRAEPRLRRPRGVARRPPPPDPSYDGLIGRRFRVTHRTTYRYDEPADESYNEVHLRPRDTARQRCLSHRLEVTPGPHSLSEHVDSFGNRLATFAVHGPFDVLSVVSTSDVVVGRGQSPPRGAPWESVRAVLERDRQPAAREAGRYRAPSRLVGSSPVLADYALVSFGPGRPFTEAVVDLCARVHDDFTYEPGFTSVTTPLLDVFEQRRGVCQDFAHLAIACLRSVGLAARYVSGYVEPAGPCLAEMGTGNLASHAWVSTYLPGFGWLDIDPTNNGLVADSHVTTAWGRDYLDVSPLRGTVEGGGTSHQLEVAVEVLPVEPAERWSSSGPDE